MSRASVAIVAAAESTRIGKVPDQSELMLMADAAHNALRGSGLTLHDIDGIAGGSWNPAGTIAAAHYLGITPRWVDHMPVGGGAFLLHVRHAAEAIMARHADVVLIIHGESGRSGIGAPTIQRTPSSPAGQFEAPYGVSAPSSIFTLGTLRLMKECGISHEQLASVAVSQRQWAMPNERAWIRKPLTVDDVLASPFIAYPFHQAECCVLTDGGGALLLTSAERARDLPGKPVYLLGSGEAGETSMIAYMEDLTSSAGFRATAKAAFAEAGLSPRDIDHLMIYDAFAFLPLMGLQDLGFVNRGEAGEFIAAGHTLPGGSLPMNTSGGGLSYTHTGMYGMFAILEAVRQLRGEAVVQVPNVRTSFVQGVGGFFMSMASLILSNEC
jgi:acetyl-CoA acetyltransferase